MIQRPQAFPGICQLQRSSFGMTRPQSVFCTHTHTEPIAPCIYLKNINTKYQVPKTKNKSDKHGSNKPDTRDQRRTGRSRGLACPTPGETVPHRVESNTEPTSLNCVKTFFFRSMYSNYGLCWKVKFNPRRRSKKPFPFCVAQSPIKCQLPAKYLPREPWHDNTGRPTRHEKHKQAWDAQSSYSRPL